MQLIEEDSFEEISALLECDLNYQSSQISVREYRADFTQYHMEIEYIRSEVLEGGTTLDEVIALIWLLKQSGDVKSIFSRDELNLVQNIENQLFRENSFGRELFSSIMGGELSRGWKSLLNIKKDFALTGLGKGLVLKAPIIQKDESIFIETSKMFPNANERLSDVKKILESKGHRCEVKYEGSISLMEIDNILYELVPDAVRLAMLNIHGVRLRRYIV